jgi:adenine-specific DNA-methyltransferase
VPTYEGRLELTWTNKPLRLLAHEDGSTVVSPSDYRVAEVRLLHDAGTVGRSTARATGPRQPPDPRRRSQRPHESDRTA